MRTDKTAKITSLYKPQNQPSRDMHNIFIGVSDPNAKEKARIKAIREERMNNEML